MSNRGGKRPGAGRPRTPEKTKRPLGIKLSVDLFDWLATVESKIAEIETALRKSPRFRAWRKLHRDG